MCTRLGSPASEGVLRRQRTRILRVAEREATSGLLQVALARFNAAAHSLDRKRQCETIRNYIQNKMLVPNLELLDKHVQSLGSASY